MLDEASLRIDPARLRDCLSKDAVERLADHSMPIASLSRVR